MAEVAMQDTVLAWFGGFALWHGWKLTPTGRFTVSAARSSTELQP